jgi:hypothetical protein
MIGPVTEHRVERLAGLGLDARECCPGTGQQFVAPALHELAIGIRFFLVRSYCGVIGPLREQGRAFRESVR